MTLSKATNRSLTLILPKSFLFLGLLSGLFVFTSCTSLDTLVVNVEKPAQITLPGNINNIVIVDNTVPQPEDIGHFEYRPGQESATPIQVRINDDVNYILAEALFEDIADKEYFDDVIFYEHPIREDNNFEEIWSLDPNLVKELCIANKADAVISIDRFLVSTASHEEDFDFGTTMKFLDLKMDIRFQVYSKDGETISPPLYINDSIYWTATYSQDRALSDTIPSREDAIKEAARYTAEKISDALSPYWSNELRWYFGDIKAANQKMTSNDWAGAMALWKSAYDKETKNVKKKARLASNIALAYELSDKLKDALRWITISCELFEETQETGVDRENLTRATSYKNDLMQRYNDFRLLDVRVKKSE
ncbi:hypothetical protein CLV62_11963 [Dysgonomonas alginatilytica]|uniref:Uncharacterized protein n=1 Tax=Dysgonomonas alginatilytica TaxID=1605892 RepID=A0A2V3PTL1_9BACT|nr:DUF6340 family protein [Dysgonomonas alginatilytica]PXV62521.1 hypothetical protein CLV62_11963 [Dysgonomonas alginatilytica]